MYILYSLLLAIAALLSLPWWALQMLRLGKYRAGFSERLGRVPDRIRPLVSESKPGAIWIHAVSVGEVLAVAPLVTQLRKANPARDVFVSTTTATGQRLARQRFGEDHVFFMPLDFGFALRPYFRTLAPALLVLAETEFWPNLLHMARQRGTPVAIVNARISDRSFPGYNLFRWFFSRVLSNVNVFLTQTEEDARRLGAIGASGQRVHVIGNMKFDIQLSVAGPLVDELRRCLPAGAPVIVCGSTTEGEEEILLSAFRGVLSEFPGAVMLLAPRHPERFEKVAQVISASGTDFVRRSAWKSGCPLAGSVFLLDSLGELASVYALATVAFVGGSLLPGVGGHNILEPAQHGVPVLTGPHTENFREIVRIFSEGKPENVGLRFVTPETLGAEFLILLRDKDARARLGLRAKELFQENIGATARTIQALQPLLATNPLNERPGKS